MEVVDFRESYELHSADHFRRRLAKASSEKALRAILKDAKAAEKAWSHSPPDPDPPVGSFDWKRQIAREVESGQRSISDAKRRYNVSERTVYRYLADYGVTRIEDSRE
jgi:ActR/RegA family two-component response regulator